MRAVVPASRYAGEGLEDAGNSCPAPRLYSGRESWFTATCGAAATVTCAWLATGSWLPRSWTLLDKPGIRNSPGPDPEAHHANRPRVDDHLDGRGGWVIVDLTTLHREPVPGSRVHKHEPRLALLSPEAQKLHGG